MDYHKFLEIFKEQKDGHRCPHFESDVRYIHGHLHPTVSRDKSLVQVCAEVYFGDTSLDECSEYTGHSREALEIANRIGEHRTEKRTQTKILGLSDGLSRLC